MIPENHVEFLQAVWTRRTPFTTIFLVSNIVIFVLMAFGGGSTNEATLMAFGVKSNPEILQGQIWRFVTPIFIHIGLLHLVFNSYALYIVGPQVEKLYGGERFVILYILTGVAGVYGSYMYHPDTVSAGASGAIFGLFGVLLVFGICYRSSIPPFFKRAVGTGVLPVIVINLIIGFTIPAIDNSAHISGLVAGAILAAVLPFQRPGATTPSGFRIVQIALLGVTAVCFYQVAANYDGPRLSLRNLSSGFRGMGGTGSSAQEFIDAVNDAQKAFEASVREIETGRSDNLAQVKMDTAKAIDQLQHVPSLAAKPDELTAELLRIMQEQYNLIQEIERSGTVTFAHSQNLKDNAARYGAVMDSFFTWVDTEGRKHGIRRGKDR